ncbi:outer membrane protein [Methylocapsa acidiphila]|uniref:outer membrane protein n=1 Tax=Methylocapsa acidiphila TaxID=133552 RepID=UPI00042A14DF|nr:outer membrane beta-barrel protein [Methylocapsa acidiphila]
MKHAFTRRLFGSLAGLLLTAGTAALAADLPSRVAAPLPPPPVFSWTGGYVTLQVGGGVGHSGFDVYNGLTYPDAIPYSANYGFNQSGPFGGLNFGYNIQAGMFVVGLQAEYNFAGISGNAIAYPLNTTTSAIRQFGSVDARVGVALDRVLLYAIGGFAYADARNSISYPISSAVAFASDRSYGSNLYGWDVGAGVEYAFADNWTARAEYRYYNWGTKSYYDSLNYGAYTGYFPGHTVSENLHTGRIGLTYKFGAPPAPIVAKY